MFRLTPAKVIAAGALPTRAGKIPAVTLPELPTQIGEAKLQPAAADAPASTVAANHHHDWEDRLHVALMVILRLLCFVLFALLIYSQEYRFIGLGSAGLFLVVAVFRRLFVYWTHRGATHNQS